MPGGDPGSPGQGEFSHVDLAVLFSDPPADGSAAPGAPDAALGAGILTVDLTPAGTSLGGDLPAGQASFGPMDPLVLVAHSDVPRGPDSPLVLGTAAVGFQQGSLATDDMAAMGTGALGCLCLRHLALWDLGSRASFPATLRCDLPQKIGVRVCQGEEGAMPPRLPPTPLSQTFRGSSCKNFIAPN